MAYGLKYYENFSSPLGVVGQIKLYRLDYAGSATRIKLAEKGIQIKSNLSDWWTPIVLQSASMTIINDTSTAAGWYEYLDLMTLEEKEFNLIVDATFGGTSYRLFDGFIDSKVISQKYVNSGTFSLTATNYISKLDNTHPDIVDTITKQTPINIIDNCLQLTGKDASILVNNSLIPEGITPSTTKTCMNLTALDTENFWKNNLERDGGKKTLEKILRTYDSFLYYYDGKWVIERYGDLWSDESSIGYVAYAGDSSYGYSNSGTLTHLDSSVYILPIEGPNDSYWFTGNNQTIYMIPGLHDLSLKLELKRYLNMTINDFSNITANGLTPAVTYPDKRTWNCYYVDDGPPNGWQFPGYKWGVLNPSLGYGWEESLLVTPGAPYQSISNSIYRYGAPQYWSGGVYQYNDKDRASLSTKFDVTIDSSIDGLKISWKFAPIAMNGGYADWDYRCRFVIRVPIGNRFIRRDGDDDYWEYTTSYTDASSWVELLGDDIGDDGVGEVTLTVPIGDVSGWTLGDGDFEFILNILGEDIRQYDEENYRPHSSYPIFAYYGDVTVTTTGATQNNNIGGIINNNTLEKKELTVSLVDTDSLNYRNGLYTGSDFDTRTEYWTDDASLQLYPISQWLIANKLQLFRKNRQKITSDLIFPGPLKPFSLWRDDSDPSTRQYVLTSYSYYPGRDLYSGCEWLEYNDDVFNLT